MVVSASGTMALSSVRLIVRAKPNEERDAFRFVYYLIWS